MYSKMKVVCFGGGTGLPALLSGLKQNPWLEITAVVNMFDTGGSSGDLKDRFGILPPGDVLKCLLALARDERSARELLQKRIRNAAHPGHTGGNVLLLGLEKVYGDYLQAIDALGQLLSAQGVVIPVTLLQSNLCARYADGSMYRSETSVDIGVREGKMVAELFLDPPVAVSPQVLAAVEEADVLCIGPGSFYTSVLSNFLPLGISDAVQRASGHIIYIANLLTEGKGMRGMKLEVVVDVVERYIGRPVDYVVANSRWPLKDSQTAQRYAMENKYPIVPEKTSYDHRFVLADIWEDQEIARHDAARTAHLVCALIHKCKRNFAI